ncbi:unnamed protein product [Cuscuta campestris]|uniref:Uncharacterized protein n=1 Tax=Cuscuta campestris TaxID=132261 RepID=A0A484NFK3_9ASTE|nr:unnamed protein product [Cuscuta campestris]
MGSVYCSESCGLSVAISLADMHECGATRVSINAGAIPEKNIGLKTVKISPGFRINPDLHFGYSWRSFAKTCHDGDEIDVDRRGFETSRNMSKMIHGLCPRFRHSLQFGSSPTHSQNKEAIQNCTPLLRQLPISSSPNERIGIAPIYLYLFVTKEFYTE